MRINGNERTLTQSQTSMFSSVHRRLDYRQGNRLIALVR